MCLPCSYWWADVAVCRISGCEELSGLGLVVGNWDLLCAGGFGVKGLMPALYIMSPLGRDACYPWGCWVRASVVLKVTGQRGKGGSC